MSNVEQIADLLKVPRGTSHPNAYQIIGLPPLEKSEAAIANAIKAKTRYLHEQKGNADPQVWNAAAATFKKASAILSDPQRKQKYDDVLRKEKSADTGGEVTPETSAPAAKSTAPTGLEGLLPSADPAAPFNPSAYADQQSAGDTATTDPGEEDLDSLLFGDDAASDADDDDDEIVMATVVDDRPTLHAPSVAVTPPGTALQRRRRRKFPVAGALLGMLVMVLFAGIIGMIYVLANGDRQVGPNVQVADPRPLPEGEGEGRQEPPQSATERRARDPVMGDLPAANSAPPITDRIARPSAEGTFQMPSPGGMQPEANNPQAMPTDDEPAPDPETADDGNPRPAMTENNEQEPRAAEAAEPAYQAAFQSVAERNWDEMLSATKAAEEAAVTEPQKQRARRLNRLVQYALEYRRAIRAGARKVGAGDSFELQAGIRVGMVEASEERVVIRAQGKNKRYAGFDDIPMILAHALARMDLDAEHPTTIAYKAAYQALAENATSEQRQEAFQWWEQAAQQTDEINTKGLQGLVEELLPESQ